MYEGFKSFSTLLPPVRVFTEETVVAALPTTINSPLNAQFMHEAPVQAVLAIQVKLMTSQMYPVEQLQAKLVPVFAFEMDEQA